MSFNRRGVEEDMRTKSGLGERLALRLPFFGSILRSEAGVVVAGTLLGFFDSLEADWNSLLPGLELDVDDALFIAARRTGRMSSSTRLDGKLSVAGKMGNFIEQRTS